MFLMRRDGPPNGLWPPPCWAMVGLEVPALDGRERGRRAGDIHAVNVSVRSGSPLDGYSISNGSEGD